MPINNMDLIVQAAMNKKATTNVTRRKRENVKTKRFRMNNETEQNKKKTRNDSSRSVQAQN